MDEIYMSYIMTGSDLGMFAKLLQSLVQHLRDKEGNGEKIIGESEEKDAALFKDLIGLLNGIKTSVIKELSSAEKSDLSDERMQELRQTMSAIDVIGSDPDAAVEDIARTIGL
jgi:transcriptional antiterminator